MHLYVTGARSWQTWHEGKQPRVSGLPVAAQRCSTRQSLALHPVRGYISQPHYAQSRCNDQAVLLYNSQGTKTENGPHRSACSGNLLFFTHGLCYYRRAAHFANYAADEDEGSGALKGKEVWSSEMVAC